MAMSRKDFVELANVFALQLASHEIGTPARTAIVNCVSSVMQFLRNQNPRFDSDRFMKHMLGKEFDYRSGGNPQK